MLHSICTILYEKSKIFVMGYFLVDELIDIVKYILVYRGVFGGRFNNLKNLVCSVVFAFSGLLISILCKGNSQIIIKELFLCVFMILLFRGMIKNKIMAFPIGFMTLSCLDTCVLMVLSFFRFSNPLLILNQKESASHIEGTLISCALLGLICFIRKRKHIENWLERNINIGQYCLILGALLGIFLLPVSVMIYITVGDSIEHMDRLYLLILFAISLMTICLMNLFANIQKLNLKTKIQENQIVAYEHYNEIQMEYYLSLQKYNEMFRAYRHDMRHHFVLLQMWCEKGETDKIESYIRQLIKTEPELVVNKYVQTGNTLVDLIINGVLSKNQKKDIEIFCEGNIPEDIPISPVDLCGLIANAIENAVEACNAVKIGSYIRMVFRVENNKFALCVENTFLKPVEKEKAQINIKNTEQHGYGIYNMKTIVEKYNGILNLDIKENLFSLLAVLWFS